jgi:hypothetical protein
LDLDCPRKVQPDSAQECQVIPGLNSSVLLNNLSKPAFRHQVGEEVRECLALSASVRSLEVVLELLPQDWTRHPAQIGREESELHVALGPFVEMPDPRSMKSDFERAVQEASAAIARR